MIGRRRNECLESLDGGGPVPRKERIKLGISIVLLVILAVLGVLLTRIYISSSSAIDEGNRGLILIASSGPNREYNLVFRQIYNHGLDDLKLVLYFTSKGTTYGPNGNTQQITYQIVFVDPVPGIECGAESSAIYNVPYASLTKGEQNAVGVDLVGGEASATNYGGKAPADLVSTEESHRYAKYEGTLWLRDENALYESSAKNFAEECTIPREYFIRGRAGPESRISSETLLPPQVNWTSLDGKTDHQTSMIGDSSVPRDTGRILQESYPSLTQDPDHWIYNFHIYKTQAQSDIGNVWYANQPVWIFSQRGETALRAVGMMLIGTIVGVAASTLTKITSVLYDLLSSFLSRKSSIRDRL